MTRDRNICSDRECRNYGSYCRIHLGASVKEIKPIAKKSKEREKLDRKEYAPKAKQFVKDHPVCQAGIPGICSKDSVCVHHKAGKNSKVDLLDETRWLAVCFPCHRIIEENPDYARQQGFSLSRHSKDTAA